MQLQEMESDIILASRMVSLLLALDALKLSGPHKNNLEGLQVYLSPNTTGLPQLQPIMSPLHRVDVCYLSNEYTPAWLIKSFIGQHCV